MFTHEAGVIRPVGAVWADMHDVWQVSDRRYLQGSTVSLSPNVDGGAVAASQAGS